MIWIPKKIASKLQNWAPDNGRMRLCPPWPMLSMYWVRSCLPTVPTGLIAGGGQALDNSSLFERQSTVMRTLLVGTPSPNSSSFEKSHMVARLAIWRRWALDVLAVLPASHLNSDCTHCPSNTTTREMCKPAHPPLSR